MRFGGDKAKADAVYKGIEPLTPDDVAELVVFAAGRRENVVIADTAILANYQVSLFVPFFQLSWTPLIGLVVEGFCDDNAPKDLTCSTPPIFQFTSPA